MEGCRLQGSASLKRPRPGMAGENHSAYITWLHSANKRPAISRTTTTIMNVLGTEPTRRAIAEDTLARTPAIIAEHAAEGATADSTFHSDQLEALDPSKSPQHPPSKVEVFNSDAYILARQIMDEDLEGTKGKTTVLNLASDILPAGPWLDVMTATQASQFSVRRDPKNRFSDSVPPDL